MHNLVSDAITKIAEEGSNVKSFHYSGCECGQCVAGWSVPINEALPADLAQFILGNVENESGVDDRVVRQAALQIVKNSIGFPYTPGEVCSVWEAKGHHGHHWELKLDETSTHTYACECGALYIEGTTTPPKERLMPDEFFVVQKPRKPRKTWSWRFTEETIFATALIGFLMLTDLVNFPWWAILAPLAAFGIIYAIFIAAAFVVAAIQTLRNKNL